MALKLLFLALVTLSAGQQMNKWPDTTPWAQLDVGWNYIFPAGAEKIGCSDGTDYNFYYYKAKATPSNLVVEFEGGGACWSYESCDYDGLFNRNLAAVRRDFENPAFLARGMMVKNASNPLGSYDHAFVPYCTGDLHLGDVERDYKAAEGGEMMTIHHIGRFNTEWVQRMLYKFPVPPELHITGCSAGGYAAIGHAGKMIAHYRTAGTRLITQHGDSAVGVGSDEFSADLKKVWSAYDALPRFIPAVERAIQTGENIAFDQLYLWTAEYFDAPNVRFSQFNTEYDYIQWFFWMLMVIPREVTQAEWNVLMTKSITNLDSTLHQFEAFWGPGEAHCIITRDYMYTMEGVGPSAGRRYIDWLRAFVAPRDSWAFFVHQCRHHARSYKQYIAGAWAFLCWAIWIAAAVARRTTRPPSRPQK